MHASLDTLGIVVISLVSSVLDLYLGFPTFRPIGWKFSLVLTTISVLRGSLM